MGVFIGTSLGDTADTRATSGISYYDIENDRVRSRMCEGLIICARYSAS